MALTSIVGKIDIKTEGNSDISDAKVLAFISEMLTGAVVKNLSIDRKSISFVAPLFRGVFTTNVLTNISAGTIDVCSVNGKIFVNYNLDFDRTVVVSALIGAVFLVFFNQDVLFSGVPPKTFSQMFDLKWHAPLIMAIVLIGGNYIWSTVHFSMWLSTGLRKKFSG